MVEEKIYTYLTGCAELAPYLTTYAGTPAIFLQEAPSDEAPGWEVDVPQYNRLVFGMDQMEDPEHNVVLSLWIDITCLKNGTPPEEIAPLVMAAMENRFFADGQDAICVSWKSTDFFRIEKSDPALTGVTLTFEVFSFSKQLTTTPDPIEAINRWSKERLKSAIVIGHDKQEDTWTPTESPSIFWRISRIGPSAKIPDTYAVTWHDIDLQGHIIIGEPNTRLTICKALVDDLASDGIVVLADKSPLFINRISYGASFDPIRSGQIAVNATYGVLRKKKSVELLNHAYTREG